MNRECVKCYWHGNCPSEMRYDGRGCYGRLWMPKDGSARREDERTQDDIDKIVSDCADFCHFADELHSLVVKSHKVDDLTGTKDKCLAYAAQLWFQNKENIIKGDK